MELLDVSAAGVMLWGPDGVPRLVASSSEAMRLLELFELQSQEGPCLDAFRTGERVDQEDLQAGMGPWPRFATAAIEAGFRSAFAVPLRLRDTTLGAVNLFRAEASPIDEMDAVVARAFADLAAISILQDRAATEVRRVNDQLTHALASRILIEQAKGIISERAGITLPEAFSRLRRHARDHEICC